MILSTLSWVNPIVYHGTNFGADMYWIGLRWIDGAKFLPCVDFLTAPVAEIQMEYLCIWIKYAGDEQECMVGWGQGGRWQTPLGSRQWILICISRKCSACHLPGADTLRSHSFLRLRRSRIDQQLASSQPTYSLSRNTWILGSHLKISLNPFPCNLVNTDHGHHCMQWFSDNVGANLKTIYHEKKHLECKLHFGNVFVTVCLSLQPICWMPVLQGWFPPKSSCSSFAWAYFLGIDSSEMFS